MEAGKPRRQKAQSLGPEKPLLKLIPSLQDRKGGWGLLSFEDVHECAVLTGPFLGAFLHSGFGLCVY